MSRLTSSALNTGVSNRFCLQQVLPVQRQTSNEYKRRDYLQSLYRSPLFQISTNLYTKFITLFCSSNNHNSTYSTYSSTTYEMFCLSHDYIEQHLLPIFLQTFLLLSLVSANIVLRDDAPIQLIMITKDTIAETISINVVVTCPSSVAKTVGGKTCLTPAFNKFKYSSSIKVLVPTLLV